jgi:hypothetical protein
MPAPAIDEDDLIRGVDVIRDASVLCPCIAWCRGVPWIGSITWVGAVAGIRAMAGIQGRTCNRRRVHAVDVAQLANGGAVTAGGSRHTATPGRPVAWVALPSERPQRWWV